MRSQPLASRSRRQAVQRYILAQIVPEPTGCDGVLYAALLMAFIARLRRRPAMVWRVLQRCMSLESKSIQIRTTQGHEYRSLEVPVHPAFYYILLGSSLLSCLMTSFFLFSLSLPADHFEFMISKCGLTAGTRCSCNWPSATRR